MRTVTLQLYTLDELSPEAREVAIHNERVIRLPDIQEMAKALVEQEAKKCNVSGLDLNIRFSEDLRQVVSVNVSVTGSYLCQDIESVLKEEIPLLVSDDAIVEDIKAVNLEFLSDGTAWLYLDKEGP